MSAIKDRSVSTANTPLSKESPQPSLRAFIAGEDRARIGGLSQFVSPVHAQNYALSALIAAITSNKPGAAIDAQTELACVLTQVATTLDALAACDRGSAEYVGDLPTSLSLLSGVVAICSDASTAIASAYELERREDDEKE